jgi:hypothetical protein
MTAMPDEGGTVGARVALPAGARPPFVVYVNGTEQAEGVDYLVEDGHVRFQRPLAPARPLGAVKGFLFSMGINFYNEGDAVDLHYTDADGRPGFASELRIAAP